MAKITIHKIFTAGALAVSLGFVSGVAHANYNYGYSDCGGTSTSPNCDTWTFNSTYETQGGVGVGATGWSNTGSGGTLATAYVGVWSGGLGVGNSAEGGASATSPNHAVDNSGKVDSILFSFTESINLTSFNAGWVSGDSDYSVLAYVGCPTCNATPTLSGLTYSQLLSNGWSLIGNYNGTSSTGAHDFANTTYSSYWLIGALNSYVGGSSTQTGDDYFKILALSGCNCDTNPSAPGCGGGGTPPGNAPEPGTLLLMSAGFFGLARTIRPRRKTS